MISKVVVFVLMFFGMHTLAWSQSMLNISKGGATTLTTDIDIDSVFISDPSVADYQVIDRRRVVVFGRNMGESTLMLFASNGMTLVNRHILVGRNLSKVQQIIEIHYPHADVSVSSFNDTIVLSGTVSTEEERDGINILVGELLEKDSNVINLEWQIAGEESYLLDYMQKRRFEGLINNIELATTKQVNVKLSIAEVSHSLMENFGINFNGRGQTGGVFVNPIGDFSFSSNDIIAAITAINDNEVGQILAEPNLSVISGESASFLVGGEMPITTVVNDQVNVIYKEFGVKLDMAAKVMRDNKIRLSLMPEVSSIDTQYADGTFNIPAFKTRRARTTVELSNGQSFVLGGLLNNEERELLRKIPFIGDIPILGSLFRYTETNRNKTELLIIATVNLVQPIESTQVQLPNFHRTSTASRFFSLPSSERAKYQNVSEDILKAGGFKQ